jgi:hypothetical protein
MSFWQQPHQPCYLQPATNQEHVNSNPYEGIPGIIPAPAPDDIPINIPLATSSTNSVPDELPIGVSSVEESSTMYQSGVAPISDQEAIFLDTQRREQRPDSEGIVTSNPSNSLPPVADPFHNLTVPNVSSDTITDMATSSQPDAVSVMDTKTFTGELV